VSPFVYELSVLSGELLRPCGAAALAAGLGRSSVKLGVAESRIAALQVGYIYTFYFYFSMNYTWSDFVLLGELLMPCGAAAMAAGFGSFGCGTRRC